MCAIQVRPASPMMLGNLDRLPPEHDEFEHRRRAALSHALSGIEVASRHTDYETSTASYFGSKDSVSEYQGYYSSSQAPDDSSDYRVSDTTTVCTCMLPGTLLAYVFDDPCLLS